MKKFTIEKGYILQKPGELNGKIYVVETGLLRSYSIDEKGKIHIFLFATEQWSIAEGGSPDLPCELFIDALEKSTIIEIEKSDETALIYSEELIKCIKILQRRIMMLMSASALERYEHFVRTYPQIVQRVPQKLIASYLGITPEALSKIKGGERKRH